MIHHELAIIAPCYIEDLVIWNMYNWVIPVLSKAPIDFEIVLGNGRTTS